MRQLHRSVWSLLAVVACSGRSDALSLPPNAGNAVHNCSSRTPHTTSVSTRHRGTWSTNIEDRATHQTMAVVRVSVTFAIVDGYPVTETSCIDVDHVNSQLAVNGTLIAVDFGTTHDSAAIVVEPSVDFIGPARVENGKRLNYATANLMWRLKMAPSSVAASLYETGIKPRFSPDWKGVELTTAETASAVTQL